MIVEEKSAGEKVCHKLFTPDGGKGCIGSLCMAWRWANEDNPDWVNPGMMAMHDHRKNNFFVRSQTHGYCGLAGSS